jgi:hypothetical protein
MWLPLYINIYIGVLDPSMKVISKWMKLILQEIIIGDKILHIS